MQRQQLILKRCGTGLNEIVQMCVSKVLLSSPRPFNNDDTTKIMIMIVEVLY